MIIILTAITAILFGLIDYNQEESQDATKTSNRRAWHKWKLILWVYLGSLATYSFYGITDMWFSIGVLTFIGLVFNFVFNFTLNVLRPKEPWYLGTEGLDSYLKRYEKLWWVVQLFIIAFVLFTVKF